MIRSKERLILNATTNKICELEIDFIIIKKLGDNNIYTLNDLWNLKRKDLKKFNLNNNQINDIIIKLQLLGMDLNK